MMYVFFFCLLKTERKYVQDSKIISSEIRDFLFVISARLNLSIFSIDR